MFPVAIIGRRWVGSFHAILLQPCHSAAADVPSAICRRRPWGRARMAFAGLTSGLRRAFGCERVRARMGRGSAGLSGLRKGVAADLTRPASYSSSARPEGGILPHREDRPRRKYRKRAQFFCCNANRPCQGHARPPQEGHVQAERPPKGGASEFQDLIRIAISRITSL